VFSRHLHTRVWWANRSLISVIPGASARGARGAHVCSRGVNRYPRLWNSDSNRQPTSELSWTPADLSDKFRNNTKIFDFSHNKFTSLFSCSVENTFVYCLFSIEVLNNRKFFGQAVFRTNFGWTLNYSLEIGWTSEQDFGNRLDIETRFSQSHTSSCHCDQMFSVRKNSANTRSGHASLQEI